MTTVLAATVAVAATLTATRMIKRWVRFPIAYTNVAIGETEQAYLRTLPIHIRIEFELSCKPGNHQHKNSDKLTSSTR